MEVKLHVLGSWTLRLLALLAIQALWTVPCFAQQTYPGPNPPPTPAPSFLDSISNGFKSGADKVSQAVTPKPTVTPADDPISLNSKAKPGVELYVAVARLNEEQGHLPEAEAEYKKAKKESSTDLRVLLGYARLKDRLGQREEALKLYQEAVKAHPDVASVYNNLGILFKDQGKPAEGKDCYRRALKLKPDFTAAHGNLGIALEETGDLPGAEACFRTALRCNSRFALAHLKLAELLRGKLPQEDFSAQQHLLEQGSVSGEQTGLPDAQRWLLHFGLAQVLDARGEYAEAAAHLDRGNAQQLSEWRKRGQEYDPQEYESRIDRMIAVCTPDFFERQHASGSGGFGLDSEVPVFVVGLP